VEPAARAEFEARFPVLHRRVRGVIESSIGFADEVWSALCRDRETLDETFAAGGEHPILVDLEAVFQPLPHRTAGNSVSARAAEALRTSVIETGLVPCPDRDGYDVSGPDLSGIGARTGQPASGVPVWDSPGIGLSRLDLLDGIDDDLMRGEIDDAVRTTLRHGFGSSHCLCHGDLGNLELIRRAAETFRDPDLERTAGTMADRIVLRCWSIRHQRQSSAP
jgi:lantibiotic modifying enzyme